MHDQPVHTHAFCLPIVRETWRHGAHVQRGILSPALAVPPQAPTYPVSVGRA